MRFDTSQGGREGRKRRESDGGQRGEGCADTVTPVMMTWGGKEGEGW